MALQYKGDWAKSSAGGNGAERPLSDRTKRPLSERKYSSLQLNAVQLSLLFCDWLYHYKKGRLGTRALRSARSRIDSTWLLAGDRSIFLSNHSQNSKLQPQNLELQPQNSELQPQNLELQPQNSELRPQNSKLQPQNSELRPQNSELRPQNSKLQPRNKVIALTQAIGQ